MKCIVIETSPERTNAHPVTNENGTPHIYATMAEARAELRANGYIYNRANQRYYINGTEYRAYILRADSEEYAEIVEQAEQQAAPDIRAKFDSPYLIWEDDSATETPENYAAEDAAYSLINAYADAIGEYPAETDPEYMAAFAVAGEEIAGWHGVADIHDRATVSAMVEAIADRARETAALAHYQTADAAARTAESFAEAAEWAADKIENDPAGDLAEWTHAARAFAAHAAEAADAARLICEYDRSTTFSDYETSGYAANALEYIDMRTADAAHAAARAEEAAARAEAAAEAAAAPIYQRYELLAYLGEPDDYDVEAIEAEATAFTADGARVWSAFGSDLAAIAERHELYTYAPAI